MIRKRTLYSDDKTGLEYIFEPVEDTVKVIETDIGFTAKYLVQDDSADSPDIWGDEGLLLVNYHRDFCVERNKIITKDDVKNWYQGEKIAQAKDYHIFMLSCLVHSGVWLSLHRNFECDSDGWDTSHVGVVLVSKKETRLRDKAYTMAEGLIETWNLYLSGDVYGIVAEHYNKEKEHIDHDSVWGYYGYKDAIAALETEIE
jgi:hypothetical protein